MSQAVTPIRPGLDPSMIEQVVIRGDLTPLTAVDRAAYYAKVCETVGLNPLTKPFDYITLNGKLVLYANKGCAEQLRMIHKISITISSRESIDGVYVVTARARYLDGREDESTGAVATKNLQGESLANAMMKAETKSKRRVTLSICGLNMLDETEVQDIPGVNVDAGPKVHAGEPGAADGFAVDRGYMIDFGKWNKKSLEQVYRDEGPDAIIGYINFIEDSAKKKGVPVGGAAAIFIREAQTFLGVMENMQASALREDEPVLL